MDAALALQTLPVDSISSLIVDMEVAVIGQPTDRSANGTLRFRQEFARLADGTWSVTTEPYAQDGRTVLPFSRSIRRHDSTLVQGPNGGPLSSLESRGAQGSSEAQFRALSEARQRLRDSLGSRKRLGEHPPAIRSARTALAAVLARASDGNAAHEGFRRAGATGGAASAGRVRYTGGISMSRYEALVDSLTGAVVSQTVVQSDGNRVRTEHEYVQLPMGALLRARSQSTYSDALGATRTVVVTYANARVR